MGRGTLGLNRVRGRSGAVGTLMGVLGVSCVICVSVRVRLTCVFGICLRSSMCPADLPVCPYVCVPLPV